MEFDSCVGILGFGVEGQSTLRFLVREGATKIVVMDKNPVTLPELPASVSVKVVSGENYLDGLSECKIVVRSAGIYPMSPELFKFQREGGELTSQAEIFFEAVEESSIIGVTGTLGKGSTVSMIRHILNHAGEPCVIGGNFGVPMLDLLADADQDRINILELSSFQLMTLSTSPHVGVVLKVSSEHLDWHKTVEEYRDAKANLVRYQKRGDVCVFFQDAEPTKNIANQSQGQKFAFGHYKGATVWIDGETLRLGNAELRLSDCKTRGVYQLENMAAATLATLAEGVDINTIFEALKTYETLPLRMEFRGEIAGIEFYNDSYATRPDATMAAVKSMKRPFSLILGGSEKNADFAEMFGVIAGLENLKSIAFIGATAVRMKTAAEEAKVNVPMEIFPGLEAAFDRCTEIGNGGAVLMSPACASFGLFKNYKVRGEVFNKLVEEFRAMQTGHVN